MRLQLDLKFAACCSALVLGFAPPAQAAFLEVSGFGAPLGTLLAAKAKFENIGGSLVVTLSNTSLADVDDPPDILTALFFDVSGGSASPALTSVSAVLNAGSSVLFDSPPPGGVVGGEWAYGAVLSGAPGGATRGISSAGFGLFGSATFPGANLDPPAAVNGGNYGITSAGDNPLTGNAAVTGGEPLIQNSVIFTLSGFGLLEPDAAITNVSFQYGTILTDPNLPPTEIPPPVPEAANFWTALVAIAVGGCIWLRRRTQYA